MEDQRRRSRAARSDDDYVPPSASSPARVTGCRTTSAARDAEERKSELETATTITPGWFLPVRLPTVTAAIVSGASDFSDAIRNCIGNPRCDRPVPATGDRRHDWADDAGRRTTSWRQDPGASWNHANNADRRQLCARMCSDQPAHRSDRRLRHRRVPVAQGRRRLDIGVDRRRSCDTRVLSGGSCVRVANILGFFVERMSGSDVIGYLISYPGEFVPGAPECRWRRRLPDEDPVSSIAETRYECQCPSRHSIGSCRTFFARAALRSRPLKSTI